MIKIEMNNVAIVMVIEEMTTVSKVVMTIKMVSIINVVIMNKVTVAIEMVTIINMATMNKIVTVTTDIVIVIVIVSIKEVSLSENKYMNEFVLCLIK